MKKWMKYVKPYMAYFILGPICMIVEVIGEVLMPKFLSYIVDYGVTGTVETSDKVSDLVKWIYSVAGSQSVFVVAMMTAMIITALLMMIGGVGGAFFGTKASVNFAADLRTDLYRKVQGFSFANIDHFSTGSLVTRLTNDITQMQNFIMMLLRMALRSPGMLIGALIMAVMLNPKLTLILAVTVPLLFVVVFFFVRKGFPKFNMVQTRIDELNSTVQENVTNVRVVKSFVREDHEKDKFNTVNGNLKSAGMDAMLMMILMSPVMTFFMNVTTMSVLWFGGNMVTNGTMTPGNLIAFVTYITQILMSLMMVTFLFVMMSRAMASAKRIAEVLDEKPDISDDGASEKDRTVTEGSVEFRNVSFRYYKNSPEKVLDGISLKIEPGTTVGIIGSTGSGKSTLVSMIPRLYDTDEGEVLVDGVNVRDYSLVNLREGVGMVLQKNVLFSGTVADNLRWGNENATLDEMREAAGAAQADGYISEYADGYEHSIEQGGANVSGGQKQRLCIARALMKKPKILILDDSTSAVDTATEARIRKSFATDLKDSTKIIIAQRITSVMEADKIIVVDDGRITGEGTHEELLKTNAEYQEIYNSQMEGKEAASV